MFCFPGGGLVVGGPRPTETKFVGWSLTDCILVRTFNCIRNDQREARERECATTLDENRRAHWES